MQLPWTSGTEFSHQGKHFHVQMHPELQARQQAEASHIHKESKVGAPWQLMFSKTPSADPQWDSYRNTGVVGTEGGEAERGFSANR